MDTAAYPGYAVERDAPAELAGPWRRAALVAVTVAAIELVALIAVLVAIVVQPFSRTHAKTTHTSAPAAAATAPVHHAAPASTPAPAHRTKSIFAAAILPRTRTNVLVLNGNGRSGVAHAEAAQLAGRGYRITDTGNAPRTDYAASIVMYRPGYSREARRLAQDGGFKIVAPLDGLRDVRAQHAQLVLILGR